MTHINARYATVENNSRGLLHISMWVTTADNYFFREKYTFILDDDFTWKEVPF